MSVPESVVIKSALSSPWLSRREFHQSLAYILGAHLEGPFISPEKKGCHPKHHIRDFGDEPISTIHEVIFFFNEALLK